MKVFSFDPKTGKRGNEVLGDIRCCAFGNVSRITCKLPKYNRATTDWVVADNAQDYYNKPITPAQFGAAAICFCIGQLTAGEDSTWQWVALIAPKA